MMDASQARVGPESAEQGRELKYGLNETYFSPFGPQLATRGWSVFPQERGERRRSAIIDGEALKWRPFQFVAPEVAEVERWANQVPHHNVAVIFGKASGNTFALDVDVLDDRLVWKVEEIADRVLGRSPFRRIGRAPKILLIYRLEEGVEMKNRSFRFALADKGPDGELQRSEDQIEFLGQGKPATFYGLHHKTGRYFDWIATHPIMRGPEAAPLVTLEMVDAFLEEVQAVRPFFRSASNSAPLEWTYDSSSNLVKPRVTDFGKNWSTDELGKVTDGRETYLYTLARRAVQMNAGAATDETGEGLNRLKGMVVQQFKENASLEGRWTEDYLRREVNEKVDRAARMLRDGDLKPLSMRVDAEGQVVPPQVRSKAPEREVVGEHDSLSFIPRSTGAAITDRRHVAAQIQTPEERAREDRALIPDRSEIAVKVQADIARSLDAFFAQVYDTDEDRDNPIRVLAAPTGAGKTTATIRYIATDERTYAWDADPEGSPGPILFLLPTYHNIEELRTRANVLNLDANLSDEDLAAQAVEKGLIPEDEIEARIADLRRDAASASLRTMTYKGKLAAGCQMEEKLKLLMSAGIGSAGLCKATVTDEYGEKEDKYCVHYSTCPAIQQRREIARSHVVFLPHAFFTLSIPEELKKVRAVIADERIFHLFVHTTTLSYETLKSPRRPPRLTKKEREAGMSADEILLDRERAAEIAAAALQRQVCPARALFDFRVERGDTTTTGAMLVASALRVCGNAMTTSSAITPETPLDDLRDLCNTPTGTEVREEYRFWKIIEERLALLEQDKAHVPLSEQTGLPYRRRAKGDREIRIQFLFQDTDSGVKSEKVRLSWRSAPNWINAPILLLDASASREIIGKVFGEREVIVDEVDAPLNVRTVVAVDSTYSNVSIVAGRNKTWEEKTYAGKRKENLRRVLSNLSGLYGYGRVVFGASVVVRRAINTAWDAPSNVDFCHFGAMRGLDFAKHHAAAVSVGRMEVPIHTIDGVVAALTFDDDTPEDPFDKRGDGCGFDGGPLRIPVENQVLRMRSGHDALVPVPMYPGTWARIVQRQYREEELKQFVGRLRPVYRQGEAPVWFAISKVVPDNVIVDDLVNLDDLVYRNTRFIKVFEAVRRCEGVLHADLATAMMPEYRDRKAVISDMKSFGFGHEDGGCGMNQRWTWGFTPVKVRAPDQSISYAFVRTDLRDPEQRVRVALERILDWNEADFDVEVGEPVRPRVAGTARDADWVDDQIGTRDRRRLEEAIITQRAAETALRINLPSEMMEFGTKPFAVSPTFRIAREADEAHTRVNQSEASSVLSTDLMWDRLLGVDEDLLGSPVISIEEDYSDLGAGTWDEDEQAGQIV